MDPLDVHAVQVTLIIIFHVQNKITQANWILCTMHENCSSVEEYNINNLLWLPTYEHKAAGEHFSHETVPCKE